MNRFHIVDACHSDFTGDRDTEFVQSLQQVSGCEIVRADETVRLDLIESRLDLSLVVRFYAPNVRL
jgi:hypothetical protein